MAFLTRGARAVLALLAVFAVTFVQPAFAQDKGEDHVQVKLTDGLVKGYVAAQKDLAAMAPKLKAAGDKPSDAIDAELDGIAKKHGFQSYEELEDVGFTISLVLDGYDSASGNFNDPKEQLAKELATVKADKSIPAAEKKELVADLEDAVKNAKPVQHKESIAVVKKHREAIEKATGRD